MSRAQHRLALPVALLASLLFVGLVGFFSAHAACSLTIHSPTSSSPVTVPPDGCFDFRVSWDVRGCSGVNPAGGLMLKFIVDQGDGKSISCEWVFSATGEMTIEKCGGSGGGSYYVRTEIWTHKAGCTSCSESCQDRLLASDQENGAVIVDEGDPYLDYGPETLDFGTSEPSMEILVWNAGAKTLSYELTESVCWITNISPPSGTSTGGQNSHRVYVDRSCLSAGRHSTTVDISSNGGSGSVAIWIDGPQEPEGDCELTIHSPTSSSPVTVPPDGCFDFRVSWDVRGCSGVNPAGGLMLKFIVDQGDGKSISCEWVFSATGEMTIEKCGGSGGGSYYVRTEIWTHKAGCTSCSESCQDRLLASDQENGAVIVDEGDPYLDYGPETLDFGTSEPSMEILVWNAGAKTLSYELTESVCWITNISPPSGTSTGGQNSHRVYVDRSCLSAGRHSTTVDISSNGGSGSVAIWIDGPSIPPDDPQLCKSVASLNFGSDKNSLSFEVWNCGDGSLTYGIQADRMWMSVTPASGSSTGEHDSIVVTIDRSKITSLPASGTITIDPDPGSNQTITVSVPPPGTDPQLCKSTSSLSYGSDTDSLSFEVWNCGDGSLTYGIQADRTWMSVTPASGSSTGEHDSIVVTIDRSKITSLPASGTITIDPDPGSNQTITVSVPPPGTDPQLCKSTSSLSYGSDTDSLSFEVWNCGDGSLTYGIQADRTWMSVTPASGSSTGEHDSIVVTIDRSKITSLPASGTITIDPDPGSNQTITVSVVGAFVDVGPLPLRVYADSFTGGDMRNVTASGNVSINKLLFFSGDLEIDSNQALIHGSGSVWLEGIHILETVPLYEAESFTIDATEAMLSAKQALESALSVGSLEFRLTGFEFVADGVIVGGHLTLPPNVGGIIVDAEVSITTSGGLELLGGELSIRDLWVGAFKLEDVLISYSQEEDYLYGQATLWVPSLFDTGANSLSGQIAFRNGMLDAVGVGLGIPNTPIDGLPVFLQSISGEVGGLVLGPVYVRGKAEFTGGPKVAGLYAVGADISIYIDKTGYLTGDGELFVLTDDVSIAKGHVELSTEGVELSGALDILGILQAELNARLTSDNRFYGYFVGNLSTPDDWGWPFGGHDFVEVGIYLKDTAIATEVWLGPAVLTVVYQPGADCSWAHWGDFWFFCDLTPYKSVGPMAISTTGVDVRESVSIPSGEEFVIFRVEGAQGTPRIYLVDPQGRQITPEVAQSDPDTYYYGVNPATHDGGYIVSHPTGGVWEVVIENPAEIGNYTVQVMGGNARPTIELKEPSKETDKSSVLIKWEAADPDDNASISLFYDTDTAGANGILIKSNLIEGSGSGQFVWETTGIPEGRYYVYAVIDDDHGVPGVAYAPGAVVVGDGNGINGYIPTTTVLNAPNPVVEGYTTFLASAEGQEVQALKVTVYDPAGRMLWHSEAGGGMLGWDTTDTSGRLLGNGVYYYVAVVKVDGQWSYVPPGKLVIVR